MVRHRLAERVQGLFRAFRMTYEYGGQKSDEIIHRHTPSPIAPVIPANGAVFPHHCVEDTAIALDEAPRVASQGFRDAAFVQT